MSENLELVLSTEQQDTVSFLNRNSCRELSTYSLIMQLLLFTDNHDEKLVNKTRRFKRRPYYYVSTPPDILLPDIHVTFPAFDNQIPATKEIDLSSNSIIRYTPVYEKQPVPTASHQHFEKILNKIKSYKKKLKNHRRKSTTTPKYSSVPAEPLPITPIAVPAYDYFPVGPDYVNQYLQISHKDDRLSCIYLKISEDSFMKVQCYPILPHTDQVETYPTSYGNDILNHPDVANVYHTLVPNAQLPSYSQSYNYNNVEVSVTTSPLPYENGFYSNPYYYQNVFSQPTSYSGFTPHSTPHSPLHSAPRPPSPHSSVAPLSHSKPGKVHHSTKPTLPVSLTYPSTNRHHSNVTDKALTTLSSTNGPHSSSTSVPADKSQTQDNDVPTKINLLEYIITPLDREPTQSLDTDKIFFRPDDSIVVEASTNNHYVSSTKGNLNLDIEPNGSTSSDMFDRIQPPESPSSTEEASTPLNVKIEAVPSSTNVVEYTSEYDKSILETTLTVEENNPSVTLLPAENTSNFDIKIDTENRIHEVMTTASLAEFGTDYDRTISETTPSVKESIPTDRSLYEVTEPTKQPIETTSTNIDTKIVDTENRVYEVTSTASLSEFGTEYDRTISETTLSPKESIPTDRISYEATEPTEQPIETTSTNIDNKIAETEDRVYDPEEQIKISTIAQSYPHETTTQEESTLNSLKELSQVLETTVGIGDNSGAFTTENLHNELRQSPITTTNAYANNEVSTVDDIRQLPITTTEVFGINFVTTTDSSPDDVRQILITTTESNVYSETTTNGNSPDDLRQMPSSTTEPHEISEATTIENTPEDLKQLPVTTTESHQNSEATTIENTPQDLRQLQITTTEPYENIGTTIVESSSDDLRELPATTTESYEKSEISTVENTPDDLRQLPITTTEPYEKSETTTTENNPDDLRQLSITTTESYDNNEAFTTESSLDDLRQLPATTTEYFENTETTTVENNPDDLRQLPITTTESYENSETITVENTPEDLRQLPLDIEGSTTVSYSEDARQYLSTTIENSPDNEFDNPIMTDGKDSQTTDDSITWFTSDLDSETSKGTIPSLSLLKSEDDQSLTVSTTIRTDSITSFSETSEPTNEDTTEAYEQSTSASLIENKIKLEEDNEIIPHETFHGNTDNTSTRDNANVTVGPIKTKLDKNSILSLSSEDVNSTQGRKIPFGIDGGNIVKVLEKNINTGNWEVQFYKVGANSTSLNSEDIDLPRRSDVLISDYDGYDNIDPDEQYEYDYHSKNLTAADVEKLSETLTRMKHVLNDEMKNGGNEKPLNNTRRRRHDSLSVEQLEQINSSYEKLKESNSKLLSDIKNITQNNTENTNGTNLNVNYLDDFKKITDKVKQYYDEKKETIRTKRNAVEDAQRQEFLDLKNEHEKGKPKIYKGHRVQGANLKQPERRRRSRRGANMTSIIENSLDIEKNNTTENIKNNTSIKHSLLPESLQNVNFTDTTHPPFLPKLKSTQENDKERVANFPSLPSSKNSKFLDVKTTPNYTIMNPNEKSKFKSFNSSLFNFEHKIETTTALHKGALNPVVFANGTNKTYIYKHENSSNLHVSRAPIILANTTSNSTNLNTSLSHLEQNNGTNITSSKEEKYMIFFQNLKNALKNNATAFNVSSLFGTMNLPSNTPSNRKTFDYFKSGYYTNFINKSMPRKPPQMKDIHLQHTIDFIKNITTDMSNQNVSAQKNLTRSDVSIGKIEDLADHYNKSSFELKLLIGKTINNTSSKEYIPMYVEMLLVIQITLLLALLLFFGFLHFADSRLNKRHQFETSVTYLNNSFVSDRIFNDLP